MADDLRIASVELAAPRHALAALADFYGAALGLPSEREPEGLEVQVGSATLALRAADDQEARPFYHFALLVPGDRFDAAREWIGQRAVVLSREGGGTELDFAAWSARACYVHDPAGNIVELIAHRGEAERGEAGPFAGRELAGISEIGIVVPGLPEAATALDRELGLELWSGSVDDEAKGLAFVGRKAHTLILAAPGRGWLPTGRPAELHPVTVTVTGHEERELRLPAAPDHVVVRRSITTRSRAGRPGGLKSPS